MVSYGGVEFFVVQCVFLVVDYDGGYGVVDEVGD